VYNAAYPLVRAQKIKPFINTKNLSLTVMANKPDNMPSLFNSEY